MNTAKKMIFENEKTSFDNEAVIGLDEVVIIPSRIPWSEITLKNEHINAIILEAIAEFIAANK